MEETVPDRDLPAAISGPISKQAPKAPIQSTEKRVHGETVEYVWKLKGAAVRRSLQTLREKSSARNKSVGHDEADTRQTERHYVHSPLNCAVIHAEPTIPATRFDLDRWMSQLHLITGRVRRYSVMKVFTGLITPSLALRASTESTV
jgi:hypothetical protein